jgi:hypothetical protein
MSDFLEGLFGSETRGSISGGLYQMAEIHNVGSDADRATAAAGRATNKAMEVDRRVERLQLVIQAMWEIMREREGVTDEELEAKIVEIDLRDGVKDGKMGREVAICGGCNRKTGVGLTRRCQYCGAVLEAQHVVQG